MVEIILAVFLLCILLKIKNKRDIERAIKNENVENISCPCCGYYCLGNGGIGCIDKPKLFREQEKLTNYRDSRST